MLATAGEVAQFLRVSVRTVYRMAKEGQFSSDRVCRIGNQWRFDLEGIRSDFLRKK